jgi:hypothetical protein
MHIWRFSFFQSEDDEIQRYIIQEEYMIYPVDTDILLFHVMWKLIDFSFTLLSFTVHQCMPANPTFPTTTIEYSRIDSLSLFHIKMSSRFISLACMVQKYCH